MTQPVYPRPRRKAPWIIGGVVALVLLLCGGLGVAFIAGMAEEATPGVSSVDAPTDTTPDSEPETPKDKTAAIGVPLEFEGGYGQGDVIITVVKVQKNAKDDFGQKPKRGQYLLVNVKAQVTDGSVYVCGCSFKIIGKDGKAYEETMMMSKHEAFTGTDVAAGQNVGGWVAFDVPKNLTGARVQYKPNTFTDEALGYWKL